MGKKHKVLSEAEIWDDSALIQSWDNALKEYKVDKLSASHTESTKCALALSQYLCEWRKGRRRTSSCGRGRG